MQPLLLLKQTLEASYDAGALLLNGPILKFTSAAQFLSRGVTPPTSEMMVKVHAMGPFFVMPVFKRQKGGMTIERMDYSSGAEVMTIRPDMGHDELLSKLSEQSKQAFQGIFQIGAENRFELKVDRNRCFLAVKLFVKGVDASIPLDLDPTPVETIERNVRECIYLPGLRGNPERNYPVTAVGRTFPGLFQEYAASLIAQWQRQRDDKKLEGLRSDLERLGLTTRIRAIPIADTEVELRVGRLSRDSGEKRRGLVNIADVGLGVSQTLPVLVALQAADMGQLVFLEEPEIHLHPRAQSEMAAVLASAAMRGVKVVVETHSALILLGIQALVAEGSLIPEMVKLHWFSRGPDGKTKIESADLAEDGSFGPWPEDFAKVSLELENQYLSAAESKKFRSGNKP